MIQYLVLVWTTCLIVRQLPLAIVMDLSGTLCLVVYIVHHPRDISRWEWAVRTGDRQLVATLFNNQFVTLA